MKIKWTLEADFLQAGNSDCGWLDDFSAPPLLGFCEGLGTWRIRRGSFGDIQLNSLNVAFAARWPKARHEGNGTCQWFFDEHANLSQRAALRQICSGQAGGRPFDYFATTFAKILEPQFVPFQFQLNGRNSSVKVGKALDVAVQPIKNPMTNAPESLRVQHATGLLFQEAECVVTVRMTADAGELKFSWPNKAAFVAQVQYGN